MTFPKVYTQRTDKTRFMDNTGNVAMLRQCQMRMLVHLLKRQKTWANKTIRAKYGTMPDNKLQ